MSALFVNRPRHAFCAGLALLLALAGCAQPPEVEGFRRGVGLGLYSAGRYHNYAPLIDEIAELNANAIALFVVFMQDDARSNEVYRKPGRTIPEEQLRRVVRYCHGRGLEVTLVPLVLLENPGPDDWRGNIAPDSVEAWFASYGERLHELARLAEEEGARWLTVGSELASMERHTERWRELIADVRVVYTGRLLYAANWDHLDTLEVWPELDAMGMSAYFELTDRLDPAREELVAAWQEWKTEILATRARLGVEHLPLIFTELGYPSQDGAARYPWDYTLGRPVDLEEQRLCYEAFVEAWDGEPQLGGVFWYNYYGDGGPEDGDYTPRGKPAANVIREWYRDESGRGIK